MLAATVQMWLIWLVENPMHRCPVTSTVNGIQIESRTHLTPTLPLLHVGSWPCFSHGNHPLCGLVLCSTDWSTFLPSCALIVTKSPGIFFLPQAQHSVLLFCDSITGSKGLRNASVGFIIWMRMLESIVKTTHSRKIDQWGLLVWCVEKKKHKELGKRTPGSSHVFPEQCTSSPKRLSSSLFNVCFFKEIDSDLVTVCLFSSKIGEINITLFSSGTNDCWSAPS